MNVHDIALHRFLLLLSRAASWQIQNLHSHLGVEPGENTLPKELLGWKQGRLSTSVFDFWKRRRDSSLFTHARTTQSSIRVSVCHENISHYFSLGGLTGVRRNFQHVLKVPLMTVRPQRHFCHFGNVLLCTYAFMKQELFHFRSHRDESCCSILVYFKIPGAVKDVRLLCIVYTWH